MYLLGPLQHSKTNHMLNAMRPKKTDSSWITQPDDLDLSERDAPRISSV